MRLRVRVTRSSRASTVCRMGDNEEGERTSVSARSRSGGCVDRPPSLGQDLAHLWLRPTHCESERLSLTVTTSHHARHHALSPPHLARDPSRAESAAPVVSLRRSTPRGASSRARHPGSHLSRGVPPAPRPVDRPAAGPSWRRDPRGVSLLRSPWTSVCGSGKGASAGTSES